MATMSEFTNQGILFNGNPNPFPGLGNASPPYMATFSLSGFTIGLPVWLFSAYLVQDTQIVPPQPSSPSQQHQSFVDPLPYSPKMYSSLSSSSLGKSLDASNKVTKKKCWVVLYSFHD